jgi:hypothetical protein
MIVSCAPCASSRLEAWVPGEFEAGHDSWGDAPLGITPGRRGDLRPAPALLSTQPKPTTSWLIRPTRPCCMEAFGERKTSKPA